MTCLPLQILPIQKPSKILGKRDILYNHLGNVLAVVTDRKIPLDVNSNNVVDGYRASILSSTDFSAFGVALDGREFTSEKYRYGFNGMEKDDDMKGKGNSYDYKMRIYYNRLARFLSIDPVWYKFPFYSSYQFASNSPILSIDLDGMKSVIRVNYPEASITLTKNKYGQFEITTHQMELINANQENPKATMGQGAQNCQAGGNVDAWCDDCWTNHGDGAWVNIEIPKAPVIKVTQSPVMETCDVEVHKLVKEGTEGKIEPVTKPVPVTGVLMGTNGSSVPKDSEKGRELIADNSFQIKIVQFQIEKITTAINDNKAEYGNPVAINLMLYVNNPALENKLRTEIKAAFGITPTINHASPAQIANSHSAQIIENVKVEMQKTIKTGGTPPVWETYTIKSTEPTGATEPSTTTPPIELDPVEKK